MESNSWDFNFEGPLSNGMNSVDTMVGMDGGGNIDSSHTLHAPYSTPMMASSMPVSRPMIVQGGFQGVDVHDQMGEPQTSPLHFSSNYLLVAAKWFQQKKLQKALVSSDAPQHLQVDDRVWLPSHGPQDAAKISLRRILEGSLSNAAGLKDSLSVGSNGSKTSSPCESLSSPFVPSTAMVNPPYFREAPSFSPGKDQIEHHNLFFQARPELHDSLLSPYDGRAVQVAQIRDAMWQSHPQVSRGVLVPSFPNHNGYNQPQDACEGIAPKAKPRVRARRGQATDPHSIAERLRRERIADRMKLLQELVPNTNKTDRAIMLDEIIEYVKFLLVQVKVLSMSRLGGAGLVVPLVGSLPEGKSTHIQGQGEASGSSQDNNMPAIEEHVARLITNNIGAALQFLQRKGLCLMPISMTEIKPSADTSLSLVNQTCVLNQSNSL